MTAWLCRAGSRQMASISTDRSFLSERFSDRATSEVPGVFLNELPPPLCLTVSGVDSCLTSCLINGMEDPGVE